MQVHTLDLYNKFITPNPIRKVGVISESTLHLPHIYTYIIVIKMSNAVGCGFDHRSGQTKDYEIGICSFSTKHVALRKKSKDWLAQNQDSVSEWGGMSI